MPDTYNYPAAIERDEDGRFVVAFPDFGWGATDGATRDEALAEAKDLLRELMAATIQRQRVLPQLVEGRVEVGTPVLVLPGEAAPLPHVGPAVTAGILARTALKAVGLAGQVGLRRCRLASIRHRSLKCSCAAELSFNSDTRHLAMNAPGFIAAPV